MRKLIAWVFMKSLIRSGPQVSNVSDALACLTASCTALIEQPAAISTLAKGVVPHATGFRPNAPAAVVL